MKQNLKPKFIHSSFTAEKLTNYSGLWPIFNFLNKIHFGDLLDQELSLKDKRNQIYSLKQITTSLLLGIISGADRLTKIESVTMDPLVQKMIGLKKHIDIDTFRYHLNKFKMIHTNDLQNMIAKMGHSVHHKLKKSTNGILDIDSTVKTVYGHQEGSAKGYNPVHKGRQSYHPQLAFLNSTKACLLGWLRPGNTHSANGAADFLKQALAMVPKEIKTLLVRGDSGYFDQNIFKVIEKYANYRYLIKVKLRNLNDLLREQTWYSIPGMENWEMADFDYRAESWSEARRFVAMRHITWQSTPLLKNIPKYESFCYVTNIDDESPLMLHRLYGDRGESENWIEQAKNQLFASNILTQHFWTNEALFLLSILAYNVTVWFRKLICQKAWRQEPHSFRLWFIQVAGKVVTSGRRTYLRMSKSYHYRYWWMTIHNGLESLCFT